MISKKFMFNNYDVTSQKELFKSMSELLINENIAKEGFYEAIIKREEDFPTGLPVELGVAIPHTEGEYINKDQLVFITLKNPIEFEEMGGDKGDIVKARLVIMICVREGKKHIEILQKLIIAIQNNKFVEGLIESESVEEMNSVIKKFL